MLTACFDCESDSFFHRRCAAGAGARFAGLKGAGGGLEYALSRSWSLKGEYLYYDLGSRSTDFVTGGGLLTASVPFKGHIVRGGVNYHFSGAYS